MNDTELLNACVYLKTLEEAEAAVAGFYALCHEFWPDEELWAQVAAEERAHAGAVREMRELAERNPEGFTPLKPLNPAPVRLFIEGVKAGCEKVRAMAYKKQNALAFSRDLEQSIIESRHDQLLATADPAYKALAGGLTSDSRVHREKFSARLATMGIQK